MHLRIRKNELCLCIGFKNQQRKNGYVLIKYEYKTFSYGGTFTNLIIE